MAEEYVALIIPELCKVLGTTHMQTIREFVHTLDSLVEQANPGAPSAEALTTAFRSFATAVGCEVKPYPLVPDDMLAVQLGASHDSPLLTLDLINEGLAGRAGLLELFPNTRKHFAEYLLEKGGRHIAKWDSHVRTNVADCAKFLGILPAEMTQYVQRVSAWGPKDRRLAGWWNGEVWT
jgi:hypothetical protein